jgi:hypothetical protein
MVPKGKIQITNFKSQASTKFSNQKETASLWNLLGA